jgi:hypothetical protein
MAISKAMRERVQAFVAAVLAEEEGAGGERIDEIEDLMVELGDAVAQEIGSQKLTALPRAAPVCCPDCGEPGQYAGERERQLLTRRGEVPLKEAKYRCRCCRRHFFPSVDGTGA